MITLLIGIIIGIFVGFMINLYKKKEIIVCFDVFKIDKEKDDIIDVEINNELIKMDW